MQLYFTTIFDKNYLSRGLSLYYSLKKYNSNFKLFIIAVDDVVYEHFNSLLEEQITCYKLGEIETEFPELLEIKKQRNHVSYLFTLSPFYPLFVLRKNQYIHHICSLDADQYFYSNPETIFQLLENADVLLTPHRFSDKQIKKGLPAAGLYNVSFQVFKNNEIGLDCLKLWKQQCTDWCYDHYENDKFADQKYLESWPKIFGKKVLAIEHKGLGLAPWNMGHYPITIKNNELFVSNDQLILFHYQGLRFVNENTVKSGLDVYEVNTTKLIRENIFLPIISDLIKLGQQTDNIPRGNASKAIKGREYYEYKNNKIKRLTKEYYIRKLKDQIKSLISRTKK
jgi:hypothetical protein